MDDATASRPAGSWHELCLFLDGSPSSFTGMLLTLIAKADPGNRARLRGAFPRQVAVWETWCAVAPCTWGELEAALLPYICGHKASEYPCGLCARQAPCTVTFDLTDPAARHALTEALERYADRQQTMAAIGDSPDTRLTWAAHAKSMLAQAEVSGNG